MYNYGDRLKQTLQEGRWNSYAFHLNALNAWQLFSKGHISVIMCDLSKADSAAAVSDKKKNTF